MSASSTPDHMERMRLASLAVRSPRSEALRHVRALPARQSRAEAVRLLLDPESPAASATVWRLLTSVRLVGPRVATGILVRAQVRDHKLIGELTDRQREALAGLLGGMGR